MKKTLLNFRSVSISRRLKTLVAIQLVISLMLVIVVFLTVFGSISTNVRSGGQQILTTISIQMEKICDNAAISKYPAISLGYGSTYMYEYLGNPEASYTDYLKIQNELRGQMLLQPTITLLGLADRNGLLLYTYSTKTVYTLKQCDPDTPLFRQIRDRKGGNLFLDRQAVAEAIPGLEVTDDELWCGRAVMKLNHFESVGTFFCRLDISHIRESFEENRLYTQQRIMVNAEDGQLLYGSEMDLSDAPAASVNTMTKWIGRSESEPCLYQQYALQSGIRAVLATPLSCLVLDALPAVLAALVLSVLVFALLTRLTRQITNSIREPISRLAEYCEREQDERFESVQDDADARDEMHTLFQSVNSMTERIHRLIETVYKKEVTQAHTETKLVRSQMNPHFVYNTLESIRAEAASHHEQGIADMTVLLGKTLRYGISGPGDTVTVEEELNHLQDYVALQRLHFRDQLNVYINIDPALYNCCMPRLILQPLVENALHHGMPADGTPGLVQVFGYRDGSDMCFTVNDRGPGIPEETLKKLTDYMEGRVEEGSSIGLKNTHRRLQLAYGEAYGLSLKSVEGKGTTVTVRLPLNESR